MLKYKICPSCHKKNTPTLLECIYCEADLTQVMVTDEETERMLEDKPVVVNNISKKTRMVRICDCGEKNPANARKCRACNEDISDITPTLDNEDTKTEEINPALYYLSSLDGQYAYRMNTKEIIIGRENAMSDYLALKSYVSRAHAKLTIENGILFIENLSGTNFTYVNNKKIIEKTMLKNGDEVGIGGISINDKRQAEAAYFIVRVD